MAFIHSKNTVVTIDSADMSAYITGSSEVDRGAETHEVTAYGDDSKAYNPGLNEAKFSVDGTFDTTATTGVRDKMISIYEGNAAVTIVWQPEGTGSGLVQDSCSAIMTKFTQTAPVNDMIAWSAEFQISGDITTTDQV